MKNKYNQIFAEIMMAAFLYYYRDISIMTDEEYDYKFRECIQNWDKITHRYKELVDLKTDMTSLFYIKEHEFPQEIRKLALKWSTLC